MGPNTQLHVTTSCVAALRRLRLAEETRILWIDAICIDQTHVPEPNHQLTLMTRIFRTASRVVVFLGEKDQEDGSDTVMDWLQDLHAPSDIGGEQQRPDKNVIDCFLQRRWFTRVWVIQEIRIAKAAIVICGAKQVTWDAFRQLRYIFDNSRQAEPLPYTVRSLVSGGFDSRQPLWRPSYLQRLLRLLEDTRDFDASDARDKLFAILPLLNWEIQESESVEPTASPSEGEPAPDLLRAEYGRSTAEIFTQLSRRLIEETGLYMLSNVINPTKIPNLPSWATDWSTRGIGLFRGREFDRSLWDITRDQQGLRTWRFADHTTPGGKTMTRLIARGALVGTIRDLGELCDVNNDIFPLNQWEDLCEPAHLRKPPGRWQLSPFEQTLFRRIVYSDVAEEAVQSVRRFLNDSCGPGAGCEYPHRILCPGLDTNTNRPRKLSTIFHGLPLSYESQSEILFYTCHGRRLFITNRGKLGLATESARVGDQVMELLGVKTPFLFRPGANGPCVVEVVGSCNPRKSADPLHGYEEIIIC
ncbi:hypothetical protein K456DRAFT_49843 [Colletotrichum gloeosporioides 23]|nr:hypothetical protein K456DRAFT_49843 [Colletotrichum gloeosporioides 23]